MRIAFLEDDLAQADIVKLWLEESGHTCQHFSTAKAFMNNISRESYDLVILDWILPDQGGDEVVKWMRSHLDWYVPVLFITVKDTEEDIIHGLSSGADDYMVKPVKPREMMARIEALVRRTSSLSLTDQSFEVDEFVFDPTKKILKKQGDTIKMTHKEFDLTYFLFRNLGKIMSRGHILENVWGKHSDLNTRTVDTHVSRIRSKLGLSKEQGWSLTAIYQHGYRLEKWSDEREGSNDRFF